MPLSMVLEGGRTIINSLEMQKKWWVILLVSVTNSFIYACYFTIFILYSPAIAILFSLNSSVLLVWALSNADLGKFVISTLIFSLVFVFAGLPLSILVFTLVPEDWIILTSPFFELRGHEVLLMMIRALFLYIFMSIIAWVVALALSIWVLCTQKER